MKLKTNHIELEVLKDGSVYFLVDDIEWKMNQQLCRIEFNDHIYYFKDMDCTQTIFENGVGKGIKNRYKFKHNCFDTIIWIENSTNHIYFELNPIEFNDSFNAIYWPNAFEFNEKKESWITLVNQMQGIMVPNTYENEFTKLNFNGQFCSNAAYMPWFSQIKDDEGYLMINCTPWDSAYQIDHPANGPYTHISMRHYPSLNKFSYKRMMKLIFKHHSTITSICKEYRKYAIEKGLLKTLNEKNAKNKNVDKLIGSAILHKGIKTHVEKTSRFYDYEDITKNDYLVSFETRAKEIEYFHNKGIKKLYLHLDGWGNPGYDNCHPDYLPACIDAGGWDGMRKLSDTLLKYNYMFGLHDQYRDYYFSAKSFKEEHALMMKDGSIFKQCIWAGGEQSYLCASLAPYYVKRNFEEVLSHGIHLEASYLDVFTCNELDECFNENHLMTRYECMKYRKECFNYLLSKNILPSSEEVNDWAMDTLVFAHYGPYDFMLRDPNANRLGIPVPLFNLVYHDCVILPWPMDIINNEDYMLYALLNGGAAYVDKDGAYPNVDGVFDSGKDKKIDEEIHRYKIVSNLQENVAKLEMSEFGFIDNDYKKQYSIFDHRIKVSINLNENSYKIESI